VATPEPLTCQELLRTLGVLLADCQVERAMIALSGEGVTVRAADWLGPRELTLRELEAAAAEQRGWRSRRQPTPQGAELGNRLRVVGAALDCLPAQPYVLTVQERAIRVLGGAGYQRTFDSESLIQRVALAAHLRGQGSLAQVEPLASEDFPGGSS
jgi:hypothetical protein